MSLKTTIQPKITDLNRKIDVHVKPVTISDRIAYGFVKVLRFFADKFFAKRYGHRAVMRAGLELCLMKPRMSACIS